MSCETPYIKLVRGGPRSCVVFNRQRSALEILTKAHSAANEQAALNAPTERTVVQRPNEEGRGMLDIFIVVFNAMWDLLRDL